VYSNNKIFSFTKERGMNMDEFIVFSIIVLILVVLVFLANHWQIVMAILLIATSAIVIKTIIKTVIRTSKQKKALQALDLTPIAEEMRAFFKSCQSFKVSIRYSYFAAITTSSRTVCAFISLEHNDVTRLFYKKEHIFLSSSGEYLLTDFFDTQKVTHEFGTNTCIGHGRFNKDRTEFYMSWPIPDDVSTTNYMMCLKEKLDPHLSIRATHNTTFMSVDI